MRLVAASCDCGAWVAWGSLATPADVSAWLRKHRGCVIVPVARPLTHATIRCASVEEAREVARLFRRTHVVGPLGASLLVRPRNLTADTSCGT